MFVFSAFCFFVQELYAIAIFFLKSISQFDDDLSWPADGSISNRMLYVFINFVHVQSESDKFSRSSHLEHIARGNYGTFRFKDETTTT